MEKQWSLLRTERSRKSRRSRPNGLKNESVRGLLKGAAPYHSGQHCRRCFCCAASHRNLAKLVAEGKFREDFYFRNNLIKLSIQPRAESKEDGIFYAGFMQEQSEDMIAPYSLDFFKLQREDNQ
jgi:uracil-DNA glycosylase